MISILGWIGNVFIVIGLWKIGSKKRNAFLFSIVGELTWMIKSMWIHQYDLAFITMVFFLLAIRSYIKWGTADA